MSNGQDSKAQSPPSYETQDREASNIDAIEPQTYPAHPDAAHTESKQPTGVYRPAVPGQNFTTAIPITSLSRNAAPVDCPACGVRSLTKVSYHSGNTTHVWALFICWCTCLGCIPYLIDSTKDVEHHCSNCGVLLATWHRSGSLEVNYRNMLQQRT
ncbi:hypothetical protein DTO166G4_4103 [Paecilomyces variotii]|nr:hypothetical protein DTO166G4_4103 [Paecilomyces variotii]KAJ9229877.1 hypothetical protein DTO166G5_7600 [Paecilomyces variotii]KAJ9254451.1 hypothetical protein DTO207G8_3642 [Paecilomyces variotii]KAJ9263314.1 hypothetical protein DTO195F2_2970 [Paecilomyces variotii]KAJ9299474.1 hypothetical protein DTO217A2_8204 [Paecilomyces variotii]